MLDTGQLLAHRVDRFQVIRVHADNPRARVADDVCEIVSRQPVVDGHEHGPDLRDGVERFELRVCIRRNIRDAVALFDSEPLQRRRPAVHAVEELLVSQAELTVDDGFTIAV